MSSRQQSELPQGTRLMGRYVVIDRIAAGGMASIYRATDERLDRVVCVKLLRAIIDGSGSTSGGSAYDASYAHFLQEALALSRLAHPNTLKIHDFGYLEESGQPYQISEFLDGGTLEQYVRTHGAMAPADTLTLLKPIVGALSEAHAQGIIHRDIKPSNILFARIGSQLIPKLADFGIARSDIRKKSALEEEEVSIISLFSPRWAAPEQLAGGTQDERTDVYSLALVTAFMLSGRVMFEGKDVRGTFAERIMGDALISRRLTDQGIGGEIARALLQAMAATPQRRTETAGTFYEALRAAVRDSRGKMGRAPASSLSSISLQTASDLRVPRGSGGDAVPAPVEEMFVGDELAKVVDVRERLDMAFPGPNESTVQVRLTMVPYGSSFRLNVKGLNCFVVKDGRPSPAVVTDRDGEVELWSVTREKLGRIGLRFGSESPIGRVFLLNGRELVIPRNRATLCVALLVGDTGEVVVMCSQPRGGAA